MKKFGLIGYPLSHSFSKKYFAEKFRQEGLTNYSYDLFELQSITELPSLLEKESNLLGLNVTIPYKEVVIPYLDSLDNSAHKVGAVNVIRVDQGKLTGFNSDYYGFQASLEAIRRDITIQKALVLGTGGASKAVCAVLDNLGAETTLVSRTPKEGVMTYDDLKKANLVASADLIVNTTPLGMYPKVMASPDILYDSIENDTIAFDLIYNPERTMFLQKAREQGAIISNGYKMLELQAEKSWEIWQS